MALLLHEYTKNFNVSCFGSKGSEASRVRHGRQRWLTPCWLIDFKYLLIDNKIMIKFSRPFTTRSHVPIIITQKFVMAAVEICLFLETTLLVLCLHGRIQCGTLTSQNSKDRFSHACALRSHGSFLKTCFILFRTKQIIVHSECM